jgi:hypothetical protein
MLVTNEFDAVHPTCNPPEPTELERLSAKYAEAMTRGYSDTVKQLSKQLDEVETVIDLPRCAAEYTSWGWPVFPLARHEKIPAIPKAKGGNGFKDATTDTERIARWWGRHPDHNIGLATGHRFDVIDIDPKNGGVESFLKVLKAKRIPECHAIAVTGSGGMHLYVMPTGKGNFTKVGGRAGIDYRGIGGYVVGPPSTLGKTWRSYTWLTVPSPTLKSGVYQ